MPRAYFSTVLDQPADSIWSLVRDFNNYPRYIEGVTASLIEDGKRGDQVGAVRKFCYAGSWIRQRLTAHSDDERCFSYEGLEPFPFPGDQGPRSPAAIDYTGTLRLEPIVDGDRTFIEWYVEYDCPPADVARWHDELMKLIPDWVASLRRAPGKRAKLGKHAKLGKRAAEAIRRASSTTGTGVIAVAAPW
jgi:hypothetical protein